jgi:hypothetical protein
MEIGNDCNDTDLPPHQVSTDIESTARRLDSILALALHVAN